MAKHTVNILKDIRTHGQNFKAGPWTYDTSNPSDVSMLRGMANEQVVEPLEEVNAFLHADPDERRDGLRGGPKLKK